MNHNRRTIVKLAGAGMALSALPFPLQAKDATPMYGLIGQMLATPGQRDALATILAEGTGAMPGCLSYIIAHDSASADALWITEVWDSKDSHAASLKLPAVQAAIAKGRQMMAGFGQRFETVPVAGVAKG
ncbi:putative quinol monooxygenase [soil metagenome]